VLKSNSHALGDSHVMLRTRYTRMRRNSVQGPEPCDPGIAPLEGNRIQVLVGAFCICAVCVYI